MKRDKHTVRVMKYMTAHNVNYFIVMTAAYFMAMCMCFWWFINGYAWFALLVTFVFGFLFLGGASLLRSWRIVRKRMEKKEESSVP